MSFFSILLRIDDTPQKSSIPIQYMKAYPNHFWWSQTKGDIADQNYFFMIEKVDMQ